MNWYKRYIGDYQRDTGHLSMVEHGAYTLMLDAYYATAKPLPANQEVLFRLLRAVTTKEQSAVKAVLGQFWHLTEDGWINARAAIEIGKYVAQSTTNRRIANERTVPRTVNEPSTNRATNRTTNSLPIQRPETRDQKPEPKPDRDSCAAPSQKPKVAALIPACSNQEFAVTESKQGEYQTAYPGVDVVLELRAVRQWCLDNPTRQKTVRGVPRFLNAWLSKAQNSGRRAKKPAQTAEERLAEIDAEEAALKGIP